MKKIYLEYLGAVTISFNSLETWIKSTVAEFLNQNDINMGTMICNEYFRFGGLLKLYNTLFKYKIHDKEARKLFDAMIKTCTSVLKKRNTLIHSIYLPDIGIEQMPNEITIETIIIEFKKNIQVAEIINEKYFEEIIDEIKKALLQHQELNEYLSKNELFIVKNKNTVIEDPPKLIIKRIP